MPPGGTAGKWFAFFADHVPSISNRCNCLYCCHSVSLIDSGTLCVWQGQTRLSRPQPLINSAYHFLLLHRTFERLLKSAGVLFRHWAASCCWVAFAILLIVACTMCFCWFIRYPLILKAVQVCRLLRRTVETMGCFLLLLLLYC